MTRGREVVPWGGSGAVSSVVGVQRVEEEEGTVTVRFEGMVRLKRGGRAAETEEIGLGIPTVPGGEREAGRVGMVTG